MTEPARHLHLVDHNGEASRVCESCVTKDQTIERLTRSYEGTIRNLKAELEEVEESELDVVPEVLDPWCDLAKETGWWDRRPIYKPGDPRWRATRTALRKKHTPSYLRIVEQGAFLAAERERNSPKFKRAYLEPMTIFGAYIDSHYQFAMDPKNEHVRQVLELPKPLRERLTEIVSMADVCDAPCGHLRFDHHKQGDGTWACGVHGCTCTDFDDTDIQAERWWAGKRAELRRRPARCAACGRSVTAEQWDRYEVSWVDQFEGGKVYLHHSCASREADRFRGPDGIVRAG